MCTACGTAYDPHVRRICTAHAWLPTHFPQTFVVPVVGGRCVRAAVVSGRVGGATLTQLMLDVLAARSEVAGYPPYPSAFA